MATQPEKQVENYNFQVTLWYALFNNFLIEVNKSQTANQGPYKPADVARLKTYVVAGREYMEYMAGTPDLDLPKTSPNTFPLEEPEPYVKSSNMSANLVQRLLIAARDEMAFDGQTTRLTCGISRFTKKRVEDILLQIDQFLDNYVAAVEPLDMVESFSDTAVIGGGIIGADAFMADVDHPESDGISTRKRSRR